MNDELSRFQFPIMAKRPRTFPIRNVHNLHVEKETLACVRQNHCVPCAYKICAFDVALDTEFTRICPNQRPEQCPRGKESPTKKPSQSHLTIGDGDLSFSLALCRQNQRVTATSYESEESLIKVYPGIEKTIAELKEYGATVAFEVDATNLKRTLPLKDTYDCTFDCIHWNFPCTAIARGQDGQNQEMEENRNLVRTFTEACPTFLKPTGQVHMIHKTKPPYNQWKLEEVALEQCEKLEFLGRIVFDRCLFSPYIPRKALDRKSFPHHDACTYVFGQGQLSLQPVTRELIAGIRQLLQQRRKNKRRKKAKR